MPTTIVHWQLGANACDRLLLLQLSQGALGKEQPRYSRSFSDQMPMAMPMPFAIAALSVTLVAGTTVAPPSPPPPLSRCTEHRFKQLVDHFDGAQAVYWQQRYFVCEPDWWQAPDGPIYFYSGNESPVEEYINNTGLMWENAQADGALLVFGEHRFFGESWPFGTREASLRHLEVFTYDQALAGYAVLVTALKRDRGTECCPTVTFGGSYGAELSFGLRAKYPWVFDAALVASGPLLTDIGDDIYGQARVMTNTTRILAGEGCVQAFRETFAEVARLVNGSASDREALGRELRLCSAPGADMLPTLRDWFQQAIVYYTLSSYPFASTYMTLGVKPLPPYPMRPVCAALTAHGGSATAHGGAAAPPSMGALADAMGIFYNLTGSVRCFDPATQPPWAAVRPLCGFMMCRDQPYSGGFAADGVNDMFWPEPPLSLDALEAQCHAKWNVTRLADASSPLDRSAVHSLASFSNMLFSNNLLDPASSGGIKANLSATLLAVNIPMMGHHADLMFSHPADTAELAAARRFEMAHLRSWARLAHEERHRVRRVVVASVQFEVQSGVA